MNIKQLHKNSCRPLAITFLFFGGGLTTHASAEIYKHIGEDGKARYSNVPGKDSKILDLGALEAKPQKKGLTKSKKNGAYIGMTQDEVRQSSWGRPNSVNRTRTSRGTHEQWVYGGRNYLYFEDGILTTIQN